MAGPFRDPIIDPNNLIPPDLTHSSRDQEKLAKHKELTELNRKLKEAGISPENDANEYKQRVGFGYNTAAADDMAAQLSRSDISIAAEKTTNAAKFKDALTDLFVYMYNSPETESFSPYNDIDTIEWFITSSGCPDEIRTMLLLKLNLIKGEACLKKHNISLNTNPRSNPFIESFKSLGLKFETASNQKINAVIGNKKIGIDLEDKKSKLKLTEIEITESEDRSITLRAYYGDKRQHPLNWPWHFKDYVLKSPAK